MLPLTITICLFCFHIVYAQQINTIYVELILATLIFISTLTFLYLVCIKKVRREGNMKTGCNKRLAEIEMNALALRAQMNPHFIFNSLNVINRYIVKADPETASLYLTKFSRLIRLILENSKNSKVLLQQELNAITLYIEMELIRFNDKFTYNIEVTPVVDLQRIEIPPMILQPYIENAIWHGLMPRPEPGKLEITIDIRNERLICIIEDNGIGRKQALKFKSNTLRKKSQGMQITSDRLDLLTQDSAINSSVEIIDLRNEKGLAAGTKVIITIPVMVPIEVIVKEN